MNFENKNEQNITVEDSRFEALKNREVFGAEMAQVQDVDQLIEVLQKYSYISDHAGERVTPVYIKETPEFSQTVPSDGGWVVDIEVPLEQTLTVLNDYKQGKYTDVQQLYFALDPAYGVINTMVRLTGVPFDQEAFIKISHGENS